MIIFVLIILWFLNIILCRLQNYNNIFFWTWNDILTFSMTHRGTIFWNINSHLQQIHAFTFITDLSFTSPFPVV